MIYNDFKGKKLSALGMGCMRFPCIDGDNKQIDVDSTREMFAYAIENGINYFDTAWGYHHGQSEPVVGELLSAYPRESFYLASKFPGYDLNNMDKVEEIFERQLERCRVDYFDFYLFHCLSEKNIDAYLDEKFGIYDYLMKQKAAGRIKHLGFSAHASLHTMKRFLEAYGKDMEFCQLQINWLDWDFQNAKAKIELAASYGIPVWVMEPVRGGSLVKLDAEHEVRLKALRPDATIAEWAFRFLQSIDGMVVTLSGMSNFQQLKENIQTYTEAKPLSDTEMAALLEIAAEKIRKTAVPCTTCRYCTEHCPQNIEIPRIIEIYNGKMAEGDAINAESFKEVGEGRRPADCLGCRACEEVCPQGILISELMASI